MSNLNDLLMIRKSHDHNESSPSEHKKRKALCENEIPILRIVVESFSNDTNFVEQRSNR